MRMLDKGLCVTPKETGP